MATIFLLATSDIIADQRVHRTASTLVDAGHEVTFVGRKLNFSHLRVARGYGIHLFRLPFSKGVLFYISFNVWAFFYLLFVKLDLLIANDLDTLLAARLACLIRRKPMIYDSHELFTEVPELINRKVKQRVWQTMEKWLTRGLKHCITVSESIACELQKRYNIKCEVVRNLPFRRDTESINVDEDGMEIILYQGALNKGRGLERLIEAMQWVGGAKLVLAGTGDIESELIYLSWHLKLNDTITFMGKVPLEDLPKITEKASLGVSLEEDMGLNYRYALPNKLFDYIQAGLPVLTSDLPEMAAIVNQYKIGQTIKSSSSAHTLALKLNQMFADPISMDVWRKNAKVAAAELNWENERHKLIAIVNRALPKQ